MQPAGLLQIVRRPSEGGRNYRNEAQRVKVDINELQKEFENAITEINSLIEKINETLQQEEEND